MRPGDLVELTKDITGVVRRGDRYAINTVLPPTSFFAVSIKVPHLLNGYTQDVLLKAEEFEVVGE